VLDGESVLDVLGDVLLVTLLLLEFEFELELELVPVTVTVTELELELELVLDTVGSLVSEVEGVLVLDGELDGDWPETTEISREAIRNNPKARMDKIFCWDF